MRLPRTFLFAMALSAAGFCAAQPVARVISASPSSQPETAEAFRFEAKVVDEKGAPLAGVRVTFTVESAGTAGGAQIFPDPTINTTDANGRAFTIVVPNDYAGKYMLRATVGTSSLAVEVTNKVRTIAGGPVWRAGFGALAIDFPTQPSCGIGSYFLIYSNVASVFPPGAETLPAGYTAPFGLATFQLRNCGRAVGKATLQYGAPVPANGELWTFKYVQAENAYRWSRMDATTSGSKISFPVSDFVYNDTDGGYDGNIAGYALGMLVPNASAKAAPPVQDMWWVGGGKENGWGMSIVKHGDKLFSVIFAYDAAGKPTWYVVPDGAWNAERTVFTGEAYVPRGAPFTAYDASRFVVGPSVGQVRMEFDGAGSFNMAYTINGLSGTKTNVERQPFGVHGPAVREDVGDMYWGGTSQNGWGVAVMQQFGALFSVWFTYGADGSPTWFVMPDGKWNAEGTSYEGRLYNTRGSPWAGREYDASQLQVTDVGSYRLRFTGNATALDYTVDGRSGTLDLQRQPF